MFRQDKSKREDNSSKPQGSFGIIFLIFSIFMVILLYWRWALPGAITWGDWWYYTKSALSDFVPVLWSNTGSLGDYPMTGGPILPLVTLQGLLSRILHCDFSIVERVTVFYPLILYLIFSPWYLAHTLGFRRLGIATVIIVFSLNSYVFHIVGVPTFALAIALGPLVMATFIQTVQRPRVREGLLFAMAVALQILYEVRISYVTLFFCALYLLYFMVTSLPRNWQILLRVGRTLFLATVAVLLIHSYWLIPLLVGYGGGTDISLLQAGYGSPGWVRALSYMTLLHSLGVHIPWWGRPDIVNPVNPQFLILPILAFSVLLFRKRSRVVMFFALSALVFSFLAKGSNPPFGEVYIWLFLHFPGFFMFREPGKWWFPIVISYAILFAHLVEHVGSRKFLKRVGFWLKEKTHFPPPLIKIGMGMVIIGAFFLIFPIQPISVHRYIHRRYEHPEIKFHSEKTYIPRLVPQEYLTLEDFLHKQPNFFRTLWFPACYRFGYFSSQHPGLSGVDLSGRLSPFCSGNPTEWWAYNFSYVSHPAILLPLRLFSIKYIIVPDAPQDDIGDYYWYKNSTDFYHRIIEKTSRFSPVTFQGKTRLYEVPDPLPHLYTSTIPTLIVGNLEALIPLAYTRYLDDQPIFFFDEQQEKESLEGLLPQASTVIFNNSNPSDLALQILKPDYGVRIEDREHPVIFKAEKEGVYQIYSKGEEQEKNKGVFVVYEEPVVKTTEDLNINELEKAVKWEWVGSVELETGEHRVTAEKAPQELVIVPEEKIIRTKEKVLSYLKKTKIPPTYFLSKELSGEIDSYEKRSLKSSFYIPSSGTYSLRTKVSPQYVTAPDYGLKEGMGRNLRKRSFVPKNVKYFTSTRKDILTVNTYFDDDAEEKESLCLKKKIRPVDLEKYPNFEIVYRLENSGIQRIEVILGIDLNNDGKINTRISEELSSDSEKEFNTYDFNLYKKVRDSLGQDLPTDASFYLVRISLKVSKKGGLDCSAPPNKGWYKVSFKDFGLYVLSENKYVKSRDYAFDERIALKKKFVPVVARSVAEQGEVSKTVLNRSFESLDLKKYPYINLIHQNKDPQSLSVSIIFNLDFNHDGKSDGKVTYKGVTAEHSFFDAYQLARTEFPDKDLYQLIKLEIRVSRASVSSSGDVSEESSSPLSLQHLQIYNEEIIPYKKAHLISPVLKIDRRKLSLTKSESWYTAPTTYLREGHHILDALFPGIETKLDFIAIEPTSNTQHPASSREPQVEFRKINPARYTIRVKEAKEPFWLVFSESYHEEWKAYVRQSPVTGHRAPGTSHQSPVEWSALVSAWKDRGKRIELKEHFMVNGYANGWYVPVSPLARQPASPSDGEMEIVVEFVPQRLFEFGALISGLTLLGCVWYLVGTGVRRRKRRV